MKFSTNFLSVPTLDTIELCSFKQSSCFFLLFSCSHYENHALTWTINPITVYDVYLTNMLAYACNSFFQLKERTLLQIEEINKEFTTIQNKLVNDESQIKDTKVLSVEKAVNVKVKLDLKMYWSINTQKKNLANIQPS